MEAKDLRIGNYLMYDERLHFVRGVDMSHGLVLEPIEKPNIGYPCVHIKTIKPIPLTEDWLLKFGFEKRVGKLEDFYKLGIFEYATSCKTIDLEFDNTMNHYTYTTNIEHVHQLQNLYYSLCQKELEIK